MNASGLGSRVGRRSLLRSLAIASTGAALAACTPPAPQVVKETVPVPVEKTVVVQVTSTPAPAPTAAPPQPSKVVMMVDTGEFSDEALNLFVQSSQFVSEVERLGTDSTRLRAMWAAGTPPDVWRASGADVPLYVTYNWPLDLTEFFNNSQLLKPDDMAPAVGYFQYKGGWYGMHKDFSPDMSLIINAAAFDEAGLPVPEEKRIHTYQDAAEWAAALTKQEGSRTVRIGLAHPGWWDGDIQRILMEDGQSLFADDYSRASIKDNDRVVEVLSYFARLAKDNVMWNPLNPSPSWAGDDLLAGRAGFTTIGYWMHGSVVGAEELAAPVESFQLRPALSWGGKVAVNPPLGGAGWFIARSTKAPQAAWELFEHYMGGPPAQERAGSGWGLPALKSLYPLVPQKTAVDKQWYDAVMWELQNTIQEPRQINPFVATDVLISAWDANLELYLKSQISLEEAIASVDQEVNGAIKERIDALFG
jgi:multiple sugar transport system substrate-binding protein